LFGLTNIADYLSSIGLAPDKSRRRRRRARNEWLETRDENLKIVSDELYEKAQARTGSVTNPDQRLKSGGKVKYLLSGLLVCHQCGANYVFANERSYACSGYWNGRACSNGVRIRRDSAEMAILGPIHKELLSPDRIARIAAEMERMFATRIQTSDQNVQVLPAELRQLNARLDRMRARLQQGDPDMTADELQAAIDRAEAKRRELQQAQIGSTETGRLLAVLPQAAELYRKQIELGINGNLTAKLKARLLLRELTGGRIRVVPSEDGSVWAEYGLQVGILLKPGSNGRGERIRTSDPLLPKQMLYQAELRPDLIRQGPGGPGMVAASRQGATECAGMRHKSLSN